MPLSKQATNHQEQLLTLLKHQIENCYLTAEKRLNRSFIRPEIYLNLRGKSAGIAIPTKNRLRFNAYLLENNQDHFLKQTVPHEIAHLIAYTLFGPQIKPHGKQWQQLMIQVFEVQALRCHQYTLEKKPKKHFIYHCHCLKLSHAFTVRRHHLALKGTQYICKTCCQVLVFKGQCQYQ